MIVKLESAETEIKKAKSTTKYKLHNGNLAEHAFTVSVTAAKEELRRLNLQDLNDTLFDIAKKAYEEKYNDTNYTLSFGKQIDNFFTTTLTFRILKEI